MRWREGSQFPGWENRTSTRWKSVCIVLRCQLRTGIGLRLT
jgi:hypothetical protein